MSRTHKAIAVFLFAAIALLAAAPMEAASPAKFTRDAWMALWQPLAEWLGLSSADPKTGSGLSSWAGAGGPGWDPHGLTQPGDEGDGGDVATWGPSATTEGGAGADPNGLSGGTEEGGAIDPNG